MQVTKEHIEKGKRGDPRCCPVALCFQDHYDWLIHAYKTNVYSAYPLNDYGEQMYFPQYEVDEKLSQWMHNFDCGEEVDPIEIHIEYDTVYMKETNNV